MSENCKPAISELQVVENLILVQTVTNNLFDSEFKDYFTENNISQQEIGLAALRGLEPQHGLTKKFEKLSAAPECNLINFIYLSYEYVLDEYFKKFKVKIILNIQAREGYSNIFSGVQNFGYFKVNSYDDSEVSNKQKSIIKEEIANALKEVPNIGIPFMDCLKDEFNFSS